MLKLGVFYFFFGFLLDSWALRQLNGHLETASTCIVAKYAVVIAEGLVNF